MNLLHTLINERSMTTSTEGLSKKNKDRFAQYFTPLEVGEYMASLFEPNKKKKIKLLDPGAGTGNLTLAFINKISKWNIKPTSVHVDLYEIDPNLLDQLNDTLVECKAICTDNKIGFTSNIINTDFIGDAKKIINNETYYDFIIMNPPYKKLEAYSKHDSELRQLDIYVPNYYAAFLTIGKSLLVKNGQMVSVTPRSFCNGPYFNKFRLDLLGTCSLDTLHLFEKRTDIFYDDVLQETVIMKVVKDRKQGKVKILTSKDNKFSTMVAYEKKYEEIVFPTDKQKVIRIVPEVDEEIENKMKSLEFSLKDLGLSISTGPIVDFRNRDALRKEREENSYHMVYSHNIKNMGIDFNSKSNKSPYIVSTEKCANYLRDSGLYVLINRMSSKEEPSRIKAAIFDGKKYIGEKVGFDNKINYFHMDGKEINDIDLATGLWIYLNSDFVDFYFRTFSGNTQVNATDLKENIKYPSIEQLKILGRMHNSGIFNNYSFDDLLNVYVFGDSSSTVKEEAMLY
jgi:adenine-specific DNA-methyltransferase